MSKIYTIGRQFGAGGRSIGKRLAQHLNIPFYDKELIAEAAKTSGLSNQVLSNMDEKHMSSLLFSIVMSVQNKNMTPENRPVELIAYEGQISAVKNVAEKGDCVIVGRAADCILQDEHDVTSFFICAPIGKRIKHVSERDRITEHEALEKIKRLDKSGESYYNSFSEQKWGHAESYNLCLSTAGISEDDVLRLMLRYITVTNKSREETI